MIHRNFAVPIAIIAGACAIAFSCGARAQQIISDDFTQASDSNSWANVNGACLTAGDGPKATSHRASG